jgi:HKD family nuclease
MEMPVGDVGIKLSSDKDLTVGNGAKLLLHSPDESQDLSECYSRALKSGEEIFIVSAYLTNWQKEVQLNPSCNHFRMVVGKDFGITRKAACRDVLAWLPKRHRANFRVADQISGFHPKAVFWRSGEKAFAIIGSSNLSSAAFETNYEANVEIEISIDEFEKARTWINEICDLSIPISEDWLCQYKEATQTYKISRNRQKKILADPIFVLKLPKPRGASGLVRARRKTLGEHRNNRKGLLELIQNCANERISSAQFYESLPKVWGGEVGGRLQGKGWERAGKNSDFFLLSRSFLKIKNAPRSLRDDTVAQEIDYLAEAKVPTRRAFLSEMLCLEFPDHYPVLNKPVERFLVAKKFRGAAGLTEGAKYIDLASRLRASLRQNPSHPAKNLAELDTVLWAAYANA